MRNSCNKADAETWIQQMKGVSSNQDGFKGCTYSSSSIDETSQGWQVAASFSCQKLPPETWQHRLVKSVSE